MGFRVWTVDELQQGDWRIVDGGADAWFEAPSMAAGAALVQRLADLTTANGLPDVDLRPGGVRIRIGTADTDLAEAVSAAARDLGLAADPAVLQTVRFVIETADRPSVLPFWQTVLGYQPVGADGLADPSRRDPAVSFRQSPPRSPRDRIHVDVVRAPDAVEAARATVGQEPSGPFGLALADADGNVVDLVPGDSIAKEPETADWQALFAAVTVYRVEPPAQAAHLVDLASAVAALADDAGLPLLVDVRADSVTIDSGKDLWEDGTGVATTGFLSLAARIQAAARELGLMADPTRPRFVQFGIDAVDVPAVRAFWASVLGYRPDPREFLTDICDPRRLNPVVFFQPMDASDPDRREHRNRVHLALAVPHDQVQARIDAAVTAGGRLVSDHTVADPEGNELDIIATRREP
jgi:hypothetical protein